MKGIWAVSVMVSILILGTFIFSIPGKHSEKPIEVKNRIDQLYPNVKKIELFARKKDKNKNWDYWGDQI